MGPKVRLWDVLRRIGPSQTTKLPEAARRDWQEAAIFGTSLAALLGRAQTTDYNAALELRD
jgi:hypothetical protein